MKPSPLIQLFANTIRDLRPFDCSYDSLLFYGPNMTSESDMVGVRLSAAGSDLLEVCHFPAPKNGVPGGTRVLVPAVTVEQATTWIKEWARHGSGWRRNELGYTSPSKPPVAANA